MLVAGLFFATFLIVQQASVFCGLMMWTTSTLKNVGAPIFVVEERVEQINEINPLRDTNVLGCARSPQCAGRCPCIPASNGCGWTTAVLKPCSFSASTPPRWPERPPAWWRETWRTSALPERHHRRTRRHPPRAGQDEADQGGRSFRNQRHRGPRGGHLHRRCVRLPAALISGPPMNARCNTPRLTARCSPP